jgi:hypothetical protein
MHRLTVGTDAEEEICAHRRRASRCEALQRSGDRARQGDKRGRGFVSSGDEVTRKNQRKISSANWLEHCDGSKAEHLKVIAAIYRAKAERPLSLESGVAVINAGRIREIGSAHRHNLAVRHTPNRDDSSYSRVSGLPLDNSDDLLIASLAEEAYRDFMLLRDLDALS